MNQGVGATDGGHKHDVRVEVGHSMCEIHVDLGCLPRVESKLDGGLGLRLIDHGLAASS